MIRNRNVDPRSAIRTQNAVTWRVPLITVARQTYYASAVSITAAASGTAITLLQNFSPTVQSIFVAIGGTFGATSFNVTLVGENQFGETVTENIAFTATGNTQSLYCYRKLTSATINNVVGTIGAATISIGHDPTQGVSRVPLLAKLAGSASVLNAYVETLAPAGPTFTVTLAPYYTLNLTGVTLSGGSQNLKVDLITSPTVDPIV